MTGGQGLYRPVPGDAGKPVLRGDAGKRRRVRRPQAGATLRQARRPVPRAERGLSEWLGRSLGG